MQVFRDDCSSDFRAQLICERKRRGTLTCENRQRTPKPRGNRFSRANEFRILSKKRDVPHCGQNQMPHTILPDIHDAGQHDPDRAGSH